jgi:hypothetical protein
MKMGYQARLGLLILAQVVVLALVGVFAYGPSVSATRATDCQMAALTERQAELHQLLESLPNPEAAAAAARAEIERLENRMPPEWRVSWLSAQIADAMDRHHIDLRAATDWSEGGAPPPVPALKRLQKTVTLRCTARNLQAFLESVNELPFAVIVEDLEVRRDEKWGAVSATVRLATFVLRREQQGAALARRDTGGQTP